MAKQKKRKSSNFVGAKRALSVLIISSLFILTVIVIALVSYNLGYEEAQEESAEALYQTQSERELLRKRLQKTLKQSRSEKQPYRYTSEENKPDYSRLEKVKEPKDVPTQHYTARYAKPKLAIIFDDVSHPYEVNAVKRLGLKVNLSFFPVSRTHPQTANLAAKEPFYMVHLPLEAMHFSAEEDKTLRASDSLYTITKRLEDIKADFPRLKYLNNHTGSKFTSNEKAVEKLLYAAKNLGLEIVDSRTTNKTKLPVVAQRTHTHLFERDVFLDHENNVNYICGQIRHAVDLAKERGKAIAIGHPRKHTIKALGKCKKKLAEVQLVYLKDL